MTMITKMKKLTFLVYHKEYDVFLEQLRELGVVHIVEMQRGTMDDTLQQLLQKHSSYRHLLKCMHGWINAEVEKTVYKEVDADTLERKYESQLAHIQELQQQVSVLDKDIAAMTVWGNFDWNSINRLHDFGWNICFYTCPESEFQQEWIERYNAIVIRQEKGLVFFITIASQVNDLALEPLQLPSLSLSELHEMKGNVEKQILQANEDLAAFCRTNYSTMEYCCTLLEDKIDLLKVKLNSLPMADGSVVLLEGWIPEDCEMHVMNFLEHSGTYFEIRDAIKGEEAPIKLKNNVFVRMYEVLTKMYGMPDYAEFDPTPLIAPFFTLFFAFCMGDAGYGLALIALGFFLKRKMAKSMAGMMNLVITLGITTTVFGTILGTFFGVSLFDVGIPTWMKQFMIVGKIGDTGYDKQMLLALLIGVVHICIAMTVKAISQSVRYGFKESLSAWGWLLLVVGFICTGGLSFFEIISENVSMWAFIVIGGISAIGIYLLNNLHRNVLLNIGAGIWDTYNMATGLMGDILSYIRLYALGLAGGMLGGVFNQLAFMVNDAAGPALGWLFCGLILIFGHALNIAMSCLSAFVHPLRLTFVEYFKNSGYEGKGEIYKPFTTIKSLK